MALSQRLEFRQTQALVMTPQLMQAIKLLQLSSLDLAAYVEGELERNPLLERAERRRRTAPAEPSADGERDASGGEDQRAAVGDWIGEDLETSRSSHGGGARHRTRKRLSRRRRREKPRAPEAPPPAYSEWSGAGTRGGDDGDYNLEAFVSAETTLADHLAEQMALAIADPARRMIGQYLIDMVDEAGYLTGDLDAVAEKLGAPRAEVEAVLAILQTLRSARRLRAQSHRMPRDPAARSATASIRRCARWSSISICWPSAISPRLRRLCGVNDEDLADMIAEIRKLNPKPGLAFGSTTVQPIVPDVFVRAGARRHLAGRAEFRHAAESARQPALLRAGRRRRTRNDKDKTYLADCLQTATWLVRALDQRAKTILKVSSEIVRQQDAFFAHGVQHLRPLNLKTVADAISMHESTVSRVTANKYMATSRGIFELKYFFTSSIASADGGEAHSAEAVRHRIRQLIDAETAADVLSDDTIVEKLREAGIDIARRTVAKYREAMRIPSSVQRRREKQAAAS